MLNVLFSTTRQWNPGDEFILAGTINLIKRNIDADINPVIYNRNPQIRPGGIQRTLNSIFEKITNGYIPNFLDNSMKKELNASFIDLAVVSGSPEWYGRRLTDFYKICLENNIPTIFMGLGMGEKKSLTDLKDYEKKLLKKSLFITTRDRHTEKFLNAFNAEYVPCPALFSSENTRLVKQVKKIGLIYNSDNVVINNNVATNIHKFTIGLYKTLLERYAGKYEFEFISHYIGELPEFYKDFPNEIIKYSYDSKDYLDIYGKYDLVIGTRVHGIGIAASMGIPGIMIAHDMRTDTVRGFLADIIEVGAPISEVLDIIDKKIKNISGKSKIIMEHKLNIADVYASKIGNMVKNDK